MPGTSKIVDGSSRDVKISGDEARDRSIYAVFLEGHACGDGIGAGRGQYGEGRRENSSAAGNTVGPGCRQSHLVEVHSGDVVVVGFVSGYGKVLNVVGSDGFVQTLAI